MIVFQDRSHRSYQKKGQIDKPGSVEGHHLSRRRGLPRARAAYPQGAGQAARPASSPLLLGFAPNEVFRAPAVAGRAVGSYPAFSPFPSRRPQAARSGGLFSVALSVSAGTRFRASPPSPGRCPAFCSVEPGLSSRGSRKPTRSGDLICPQPIIGTSPTIGKRRRRLRASRLSRPPPPPRPPPLFLVLLLLLVLCLLLHDRRLEGLVLLVLLVEEDAAAVGAELDVLAEADGVHELGRKDHVAARAHALVQRHDADAGLAADDALELEQDVLVEAGGDLLLLALRASSAPRSSP